MRGDADLIAEIYTSKPQNCQKWTQSAQIASRTKKQPYVEVSEVNLPVHNFILVYLGQLIIHTKLCYRAFVAGYLTTT